MPREFTVLSIGPDTDGDTTTWHTSHGVFRLTVHYPLGMTCCSYWATWKPFHMSKWLQLFDDPAVNKQIAVSRINTFAKKLAKTYIKQVDIQKEKKLRRERAGA